MTGCVDGGVRSVACETLITSTSGVALRRAAASGGANFAKIFMSTDKSTLQSISACVPRASLKKARPVNHPAGMDLGSAFAVPLRKILARCEG